MIRDKIDVRCRDGVAAGDRSKRLHVVRAVPCGDGETPSPRLKTSVMKTGSRCEAYGTKREPASFDDPRLELLPRQWRLMPPFRYRPFIYPGFLLEFGRPFRISERLTNRN